jgi:hypothetical protein
MHGPPAEGRAAYSSGASSGGGPACRVPGRRAGRVRSNVVMARTPGSDKAPSELEREATISDRSVGSSESSTSTIRRRVIAAAPSTTSTAPPSVSAAHGLPVCDTSGEGFASASVSGGGTGWVSVSWFWRSALSARGAR